MVEGKPVSEFSAIQMECKEGNGKDISTTEGHIVWE
ncbi:MAG: hypothetical protein ACI9AU_001559 [Bacteroidia bacterium]|jgi:hypothetical protein